MARRTILLGLLGLGLVLVGGYLGYGAGLAADADTRPFSEAGGGFLWGIAFFFKFLFIAFLIALVAKLFFFWGRGPRGKHGGRGHHGGHRGWHRYGDDDDDEDYPDERYDRGDRPQVA
jgi:hypothetical protein